MKALKRARKPSIFEWLFAVAIVGFGIFLLVSIANRPLTPKADLIIAEGIPSTAKVLTVTSGTHGPREILHFTVAGHDLEWASADPKFAEIKSALASAKPVKVGLSTTKPPIPISDGNGAQFFTFAIGGQQILTFEESHRADEDSAKAVPLGGWVFIVLGLLGLFINWTQLQNFNTKASSSRY